jgi:hypothetical protein
VVEVDYLGRLAELARKEPQVPAGLLQRALRVVREAERAAACEPSALPWIHEELTAADTRRREAEALLFQPGPADRFDKARRLFEDVDRQYRSLAESLVPLEEAYRTYDRLSAVLPSYLPYLAGAERMDVPEDESWRGTIQALLRLQELLAGPTKQSRSAVPLIRQTLEDLERSFDGLSRPFGANEVTALLRRAVSGNLRDFWRIHALLECPRLDAKQRAELWEAEAVPGSHRGKVANEC